MFDFSILFYILISIAAIAAIATCTWGLAAWRRIANYVPSSLPSATIAEEVGDKPIEYKSSFPSLTVVVYNFCRREMLDEYLKMLMSQTYPNYNVVMVCDASSDVCAATAEKYAGRWDDRLYITFIPPGSHNLSRRKLALTLGIKAASGDYILTTSSNCIIQSEDWLSSMMAPICTNDVSDPSATEVVLGYSAQDFSELTGGRRWFRQFDTLCTSAQWLGAALDSRPYRGDGFNLLFKRSLFFDKKGYSASINLVNGDDDLFVQSIVNEYNTAVMLNSNSLLTTSWGDSANRIWGDLKERYDFTQRWLPKRPFFNTAAVSAMQWVVLCTAIVAAICEWPLYMASVFSFNLLALFYLAEILIYRRVAARLRSTKLWWALPLFMLIRPFSTLLFRIAHQPTRIKNFTWQRRK